MPTNPKFAASIVRPNSQIKNAFCFREPNQEARLVSVQNVNTLAYCDYKLEKTRHFPASNGCSKAQRLSASGGFRPLTPNQGLLPLDPAGGSAPDPRYRLALRALAMCPSQTQFLDPQLPWTPGELSSSRPPFLVICGVQRIS